MMETEDQQLHPPAKGRRQKKPGPAQNLVMALKAEKKTTKKKKKTKQKKEALHWHKFPMGKKRGGLRWSVNAEGPFLFQEISKGPSTEPLFQNKKKK